MREKKEINIQIGERIKLARENAGLTQEQLAERIEVSPQYISDLERGVVGTSLATLKRICISLAVSADDILFGSSGETGAEDISLLCRDLSPEQRVMLKDIVSKIVEAIRAAQCKTDV